MALEGIRGSVDDIVTTTGSQQALDLVTKLFIDPGDVILAEGLADAGYIADNTTGIDELRAEVAKWDPTTAAAVCGIDEDRIRLVARLYARAPAAMHAPR